MPSNNPSPSPQQSPPQLPESVEKMLTQYQEVHWNTIYIEDRFYIAHPLELDRLMKLSADIRKEKNKLLLNQDQGFGGAAGIYDPSEKSQADCFRPLSGISRDCRTEVNQIQKMREKIKVEKELMGEEQKFQQRLSEKKRQPNKMPDIISQDFKQSESIEKPVSNKTKQPIIQNGMISQEMKPISNSIVNSPIEDKVSEAKKTDREGSNKEEKKEAWASEKVKPKKQQGENNYISFQPTEVAMNSSKFEPNKTKTANFGDDGQEDQYNTGNSQNNLPQPNKNFVVNLRKSPSNSKEMRESNSRRDLKSASSAASKIQLEALNRKIKEMQDKLAQVQEKQRKMESTEKSKVVQIDADYKKPKSQSNSKMGKSQLDDSKAQQLRESGLGKRRIQKSSKVDFQNMFENKSSVLSNDEAQVPHNFDMNVWKSKKLNIASSTVAYNYNDDELLQTKKKMEKMSSEKERMNEEIVDLKNNIRELRLEKMKLEGMIEQLEKKQKEKSNLNALLSSKLDKGNNSQMAQKTGNLRLTQKGQKTQQSQAQQFPLRKKRPNIKMDMNGEEQQRKQKLPSLKKTESNQSPDKSKKNFQSIYNGKTKQFQPLTKIGNTKEIVNTSSANPEEPSSYREFRPYPLIKKGIIAREVIEKDDQPANHQSLKKKNNSRKNSMSPQSPVSTGRKIFQLQFIKQPRQTTQISDQQPNLTPPQIKVRSFNTPKLPETPDPDISQVQLLSLAKTVCNIFSIKVQSDDSIYMKKYKNCIIFKTPDIKRVVVWHYTGKFYVGGWEQNDQGEGKKTGDGFQYLSGKFWYQGQFLDGKKNGSGTMVYENGNIYAGQWVKGLKQGLGTFYEESSGAVYEGEWKEDKKEGKGILKISDNEFYDGTFVKSVKHGYGIELFSNGDYYKGEYKMSRFHGKGKYCWKNGASYDGTFVQGRRQGTGRWRSSKTDADTYFGQYKNDKKSGKGQYTWNNGTIYEGYFFNDIKYISIQPRHGQGKVEYPDGREIKGYWQNGKLIEIDQSIEESQMSSQRNASAIPFQGRVVELSSKELQPSRKLTKL